ncbi:unnamed protein product [Meganyctiphanes norvegica]|uniref:F5/8 type C domain-containing protein n=1 Tax=Meganyctiphanes norvegica TaxID=48144 RepID=A0AAV2RLR1_MEGNR
MSLGVRNIQMCKMILVFVLVFLVETKAASSDKTTTFIPANRSYNWSPRDPGDTLWFTTNATGVRLTLTYMKANRHYEQFSPSYYDITDTNVWHRIIYKAEPGKYLTICPKHNFEKVQKEKVDPEIGFVHSTGFVQWSKSIPDLTKPIKVNSTGIQLEGPETVWKPTGLSNHYNNWSTTVDLKEIYLITKISFKLQGDNTADVKSFKLEVSKEVGSMKEVFNENVVTTGVSESQSFSLPEGSSGRYCKFTVIQTVSRQVPIIEDLSYYGFTECSTIKNEEVTSSTIEVSTSVYSSTPQSTLECHKNSTVECHTPPGKNEVCTKKHIETCSDTLICENTTISVCKSSSNNVEKVCENSTETKCKTSTKDYFDENGCGLLNIASSDHSLVGSDHSSSALYTSIVFNILLVLVMIVLGYLLYAQTGCICNNYHNYRKARFEPPAHPPTPPPIRNPVLERLARNDLDNPASRQSEHIYDSPHEYRDLFVMKHPEEITIRENPSSRRESKHDSVNSFYAALNQNIQDNNY